MWCDSQFPVLTFGRAAHISVTEAANKRDTSKTFQIYLSNAQILHVYIPNSESCHVESRGHLPVSIASFFSDNCYTRRTVTCKELNITTLCLLEKWTQQVSENVSGIVSKTGGVHVLIAGKIPAQCESLISKETSNGGAVLVFNDFASASTHLGFVWKFSN